MSDQPSDAALRALVEKWRSENGYYPESKEDCAYELEELLASVPASPSTREGCKWTEDSDWDDTSWDTDCGQKFTFIDGGPKENSIAFCCYCGKPVTAVPAPAVSPDPEDK